MFSFHVIPGSEGTTHIARLLKENFYIIELDLAQNKLSSTGAHAMAEVLTDNNTLKKVNLSWNEFKDKDAECLAEGIRANQSITWLDLSHNEFAEDAGMLLGENNIKLLCVCVCVCLTEEKDDTLLEAHNPEISICNGMRPISISRTAVARGNWK